MEKEMVSENGSCLQISATKKWGDLSLTIEQLAHDLTIQAQLTCELIWIVRLISNDKYVLKDKKGLFLVPKVNET